MNRPRRWMKGEWDSKCLELRETVTMASSTRYNKISIDIKKLIIEQDKSGYTASSIASNLNVKFNSVNTILSGYRKDGQLIRQRGHRSKKLSSVHLDQLRNWLSDNCQLTLVELVEKLYEHFDIRVCPSTISNYLKRGLFFSLKSFLLMPVARNTESPI